MRCVATIGHLSVVRGADSTRSTLGQEGYSMRRLVGLVGAVSVSLTFAVVAEAGAVKTTPVTFTVNIQNTSLFPCLGAGGGPATIAATLVAPKPLPPNVTLYLHGLGFGRWFWH